MADDASGAPVVTAGIRSVAPDAPVGAGSRPPMARSWSSVDLPIVGKTVSRLGLAPNYGLTAEDIPYAAERGFTYWVWSPTPRFSAISPALKEILRRDRDKHVVAVLGGGYFPWMVRWSLERARVALGIDQVDILQLGWLGVTSALTDATAAAMRDVKAQGLVRATGASIHDRPRAGRLAAEGALDMFMLRYNAAHPGAEREVFPHLAAHDPIVVAYTGTSWRQLLKPPKTALPPWPGRDVGASVPPMTAALCYRFQLQSPHVHVALTGPGNRAQLDENLRALADGPLTSEEEAWIRAYGAACAGRPT